MSSSVILSSDTHTVRFVTQGGNCLSGIKLLIWYSHIIFY